MLSFHLHDIHQGRVERRDGSLPQSKDPFVVHLNIVRYWYYHPDPIMRIAYISLKDLGV